jgi:hypothetical protein
LTSINGVWLNESSCVTEEVERRDQEEEDDSSYQPPKDNFVQNFNSAAQNLVRVGPISSLVNEHFYVVLEQLEELEDIEGSL